MLDPDTSLAATYNNSTHDFTDPSHPDDDSNSGSNNVGASINAALSAALNGSAPAAGLPHNTGGTDIPDMLIDYNDRFAHATPAAFRDDEINATLCALVSATKPNALLMGPAGVGKTRIVEDLARRLAADDPTLPNKLRGKRIYELPLSALISGAMFRGQMEERVTELVAFASDPDNNAIVFIDEIHQLFDRNSQLASVSQQLKPGLARGDLHVIAATTSGEAKQMDTDPAFVRRFTTITVGELSAAQTRTILGQALPNLLAHHGPTVSVSDTTLDAAVRLADTGLPSTTHRPDGALTLLDRAMSKAVITAAEKTAEGLLPPGAVLPVKTTMIERTVAAMTGGITGALPPVSALDRELAVIVGQDHVTAEVRRRIEVESLGAFTPTAPVSWLFAGTSGVGKTETARIVSRYLTGDEPIRIDCAEFSESHQVSRLIGSPPGYVGSESSADLPFEPLLTNPRRLILLDELEKAHSAVKRLFFGALDTGTMTMASGREIDFTQTIIVATTNAADHIIGTPSTGFAFANANDHTSASGIDPKRLTDALAHHFDRALLGRFSWITAFNRLTPDNYRDICAAAYITARAEAAERTPARAAVLPDTLDDAALDKLVATTFNSDHGARPARRAVTDVITDMMLGRWQHNPSDPTTTVHTPDPALQLEQRN